MIREYWPSKLLRPSSHPSLRILIVSSACALFGLACLGRSPDVEHYMLGTESASAPSGEASEGSSSLAVLVGPVVLPGYLERSKIARLASGGEVDLDEFTRWLGGFEENFLRSLSLGLARELGSLKVVAYPSSAPFPLNYRVRLHVDDLVLVDARDVLRVRIRWALIEEGGEKPAELFLMETELPVERGSNAGLVRAHEAALSQLTSSIARALRQAGDRESEIGSNR
jgi:uncharacterized lipoprotein YmbA